MMVPQKKGISYSRVPFSGSMLMFGGVTHIFYAMKWAFWKGSHTGTKRGYNQSPMVITHWTKILGWSCQVPETSSNRFFGVPPRKLTWNLKMMVSNRNLLFQGFIFRFHVSFPGCNPCETSKPTSHPINENSRGFWDEKYTNSKRKFLQSLANLQVGLGYMVPRVKKLSPSHLSLQNDFRIITSTCWKTLGVSFSTLI